MITMELYFSNQFVKKWRMSLCDNNKRFMRQKKIWQILPTINGRFLCIIIGRIREQNFDLLFDICWGWIVKGQIPGYLVRTTVKVLFHYAYIKQNMLLFYFFQFNFKKLRIFSLHLMPSNLFLIREPKQ